MRSLSIAATGMMAQTLNVETISNNIANMNTTGFKRQRAEFEDLLYTNLEKPGIASSNAGRIVPTGIQIGTGVKTGSVYRITEQGPLTPTGNKLDLAVSGRGYFAITLPSGETGYTRAGNFSINADGELVTADGYQVAPGIVVPADATDIAINQEGVVQATIPGATAPQTVGQIQLANFVNPTGLEAIGDNLFLETAASGPASIGAPKDAGFGAILQGYVENANVDAVTEISALIVAQRAYEMNAKVITASDEMMSTTANLSR